MAVTVGAVYVDVLPSTRDFVKQMVGEILPEADKAGKEIGERVGKGLGEEAGKAAKKGIEEGVEDADTEGDGAKKGRKTGGAFAKAFKAELETALRSLPDVDIDGDNSGALAEVAEVRAALESLSKQTVGVTIDADDGLRAVRRIREDLLAIQDRTVDVDFDIDSALSSLGALEKRMLRTFQDSQGSFARSIRGAIDSAVRALPEIELTADITEVEQDIAAVRGWLAELSDKRIDIDISTPDLIAEITRIDALLVGLEGPHTIRVQTDIDAARAALSEFSQYAAQQGQFAGGEFMNRWRSALTKASETLPEIKVDADTTPANEAVALLRSRLATLAARIGVDVDAAEGFRQLTALQALAAAIDRDDIDINVRADLASVVAQMTALRGVAATTADVVDEAVGAAAAGRVGRFRLILTAVVALLPLIAGAVVALPAAFAALIGPIAAIALGTQGIVNAFNQLTPVVNELKKATAAAFQEGLEPTIARLQQAIPGLTDDFVRTAEAISFVAEQITITATSAKSLNGIQDNFYLLNEVVRQAAPGLQLLTENIIRLTTIGLRGMDTFGEEMRQVGEVWAGVIARLQASGAAEAAVRALFQVLSEVLNLAAGLTEFGAVLGAAFGPALAAAVSGLAQIFSTLAQALDSLPEPLRTVASIATVVGLAMAVLGTRIVAAATAMRTGLVSAATTVAATFRMVSGVLAGSSGSILGVGVAARTAGVLLGGLAAAARGLWTALGGPVGIAITAITVALGYMGQGQADAAAAAEAHKAAVEQLATALASSGGAIDAQVVKLTTSTLESKNLGAQMDLLGESVGGVSLAVAQGGPQYDALIAKLQGVVTQGTQVNEINDSMGSGFSYTTTSMTEEAKAAQLLLTEITGMRQGFVDAAAANAQLAQNLFSTGQSLADGTASAKAMEAAFATLKNEMTSVEEKGNALYLVMLQLTGQAIPAGLAQGQLGQAVRDTGKAFDEFKKATKESGDQLITASGQINVASEAGNKLAIELQGLEKDAFSSASAVFENAGGMDNVAAASAAAAREIQFARDRLIDQAMAAGATREQANLLADSYGLIPQKVVTLLTTEGIPQVEQDLLTVGQRVASLPNQKVIGVGALTDEAVGKLQALGITVQKTVDGGYEVVIQDQAARDRLQALIQSILHPPGGQPNMPTGLDGKPAQADQKNIQQGIVSGQTDMPVGVDGKPVERGMPQVQQQVTQPAGGPPGMPVQLDPAKVPQQAQDVANTVLGTVATMPINPIKGSGWDAEIALIRDSVVGIVGGMPIDAVRSVNFDAQLEYIRTTVLQGAPATLPIVVAHAPTFAESLSAITAPLLAPPYSALFITVMKAPTFDADLQAIKDSINGIAATTPEGGAAVPGAMPALQITVAKSPTFDADLQAIKDSINAAVEGAGGAQQGGVGGGAAAPISAALQITVAKAPTFDADLQLIKDSINGPAAVAPGAAGAPAAAAATALLITVAKAPTFDADLQLIKDSINGPAAAAPGAAPGAAPAVAAATALLITVAKAPTFDADLQLIKDSINGPVAAPGAPGGGPGAPAAAAATALLITVAKSPAFDPDLAAIKASINGGVPTAPGGVPGAPVPGAATAILVTVAKSPTFDIDLATIKASINGGVAGVPGTMATPILVSVLKAPTFDADLLAIRNLITTPPALPTMLTVGIVIDTAVLDQFLATLPTVVTYFTVTADIGPAIDIVLALLDAIAQTITFFTVVADTVPAQNAVIELVNWISSLVVPITVIAQFGGFGGMGMAQGGVARSSGSNFDEASAASQRLGGGSSFGGPVAGGGGAQINPGGANLDWSNIDDLRNAFGRIVLAMAAGGAVGSSMRGGIAAIVPPNTWRVIGDRVRDDEAYIPINGAARSHAILSYTAARMGYGLAPQATGSFMSSGSVAYNDPSEQVAINGEGGSWRDRQGPLIGQVVASPNASAADLADEVMFRLRVQDYGGVNGVRR